MSVVRHLVHSQRRVLVLTIAVGLLVGCSGDRVVQPARDGEVALPQILGFSTVSATGLGAPVPIDFVTYDSSHQVVHPSVQSFPSGWHGRRYWLALTPYPNSDSRLENPSLFASSTGDDWTTPAGVTNPIVRTRRGYLSDPDLAYDPSADELRLYYREVVQSRGKHNKRKHQADNLYLTRSANGVNWSTPLALSSERGRFVVSPAVARRTEGDWKMWSIDAGHTGCQARHPKITLRRSVDGIAWSAPAPVMFSQPGYLPWHMDVEWVSERGAYWALVAAYPQNRSCTETSLFLATSPDGMRWTTYPSPVLAPGALPQFSTNVYRSTFAFAPDGEALTIWLTGAKTITRGDKKRSPTLRWSAAVWHTHARALLSHVGQSPIAVLPNAANLNFLKELAAENALP